MSLRRIPGTVQQYYLISYDKKGDEVLDADGTHASREAVGALTAPGANITDVFILSHGWQGDYDDAISQYDRWIAASNPDAAGDGIRPFIIGVHWPSKAWSDRELKTSPSGLLDDEPVVDPADAISVGEAVDEYAAVLELDDDEAREALTTVLESAANIEPDRDAAQGDTLPRRVADAYRTLAGKLEAAADDGLLSSEWDADTVFVRSGEFGDEPTDTGGLLGGGGALRRLRDIVLAPLRQLAFWHGKNQAREFGENGAAQLVRDITRATDARIHLMGHSFGTIVVTGAVRGPCDSPAPPPRPVDSLFLVQGAVSLWAFADRVPEDIGGGRGYFADVVTEKYVAGPIVVTTSEWDYAVGRLYPLAVKVARQYLLDGELPKYGGIGSFGIQGVESIVVLDDLTPGSLSDRDFAGGTVYNIDASEVINKVQPLVGAHNDLAHPELSWLGWNAATRRA